MTTQVRRRSAPQPGTPASGGTRACAYLRVSTGRQAESDLSIPDQRRQVAAFCAGKGWSLVSEHVEPGGLGDRRHRAEFQKMIERATDDDRPFDVIVVHSYSRFFRDAFGLEMYIRRLAKAGVRLVSITQELGDDPAQVMMRQVIALFEEAIGKVNEKHKLAALDLALRPIRIDRVSKGHSYTIDSEILSVIDGSGLLIADLTQGNKNVYHEVGFMMGLNKGRGGEQNNFILIADQSKLSGDKDIGFNLRAWQQLRFLDTLELVKMRIDALEQFYKLK